MLHTCRENQPVRRRPGNVRKAIRIERDPHFHLSGSICRWAARIRRTPDPASTFLRDLKIRMPGALPGRGGQFVQDNPVEALFASRGVLTERAIDFGGIPRTVCCTEPSRCLMPTLSQPVQAVRIFTCQMALDLL